MTIPATDVTAVPPKRRRSRVIVGLVITVVAAVVVVIGIAIVSVVIDRSWQRAEFESLAEHPDSSVLGTIAYLADESRCVRIAAAAGQPAKDVPRGRSPLRYSPAGASRSRRPSSASRSAAVAVTILVMENHR